MFDVHSPADSRQNSEGETCPQCGTPAEKPAMQKTFGYLGSIFILAVCMVMFLFVFTLLHGNKFSPRISAKNISIEAVNASREFVTRKLRSPFSAQFPLPAQVKVSKGENNQYTVISYVDARNFNGRMVRKHYECVLRYEPGKDRWSLVKVTFEK